MSHSIIRSLRLPPFRLALIAIVVVFAFAPAADAQNEALLRLLQVLRDRGSITAQEYEEIRKVAESPQTAAPAGQVSTLEKRVAEQEKTVAAIKAQTDGNPPPVVSRALAGKWYERIGLRGYTQFRGSDVFDHEGPPLEVPNDRSVNENETLIIRRGRFVFSGDVTDRLSLYAQSDFNGSTGAADFSVQMRDLYADIWLDKSKFFRVRAGQSKIPFGWVNMQSSQNRAPLERPDGINSAAEGERDYGATFMWTPATAKQAFRDITAQGLKGTGDYGLVAFGVYAGQGPNRSDQNGQTHVVGRVAYPFKLASGQFVEVGVQAYHGRFVTPLQAIAPGGGASITPTEDADGELDQRVGLTAVWYPQPIGVEAEWSFGRGPELSADNTRIESESLHGGYVQVNYRAQRSSGTWFPFTRWNYYDGARKFARNAPPTRVNEVDIGLEFAKWAELELTGMYTHTFKRTRTGSFPYTDTINANRIGLQLQWNY
jgi:Phosphate-selective porin O and P